MTVFALCVATVGLAQKPFPVSALPEEWVEGKAPEAWEPGHFYIIECWATWCGPCRQAMPHMEKLNQAVKGEPVHIIGVSIDTNVDKGGLRKFLKGLSVTPTYTMGIDPNGARIKPYQAIFGVPFAMVVCDGEIIQTAHPMDLEAGNLIERARASVKNRAQKELEALSAKIDALQSEADALAAKKQWDKAAKTQLEAVKLHAKRLGVENWNPTARTRMRVSPPGNSGPYNVPVYPPAEETTEEGAAAPFAKALGEPIPADKSLTILTLISPKAGSKASYETLPHFPGVVELALFGKTCRVLFFAPEEQKADVEALLESYPFATAQVHYRPEAELRELFGLKETPEGPTFAVFYGGKRVWQGNPLDVPPALARLASADEDVAPKALALLKEQLQERKDFAKALTAADQGSPTLRQLQKLYSDAPSDAQKADAIYLLFDALREANKLDVAKNTIKNLTIADRTPSGLRTLQALEAVFDEWPELAEASLAARSTLWAARAETLSKTDPLAAEAAWLMAARYADAASPQKTSRGDELRRSALTVSAPALRYQRLLKRQPTLPAR